jgi:hypothetical protein
MQSRLIIFTYRCAGSRLPRVTCRPDRGKLLIDMWGSSFHTGGVSNNFKVKRLHASISNMRTANELN